MMKSLLSIFALFYLRFLAKLALFWHKPVIIGITGSVGKSSTKNAVEAILKEYYPVKTVGNSETGIPLGILGITPADYSPLDWLSMLIRVPFGLNYLKGTKYLIAEMGIDDPYPPKNMEYLLTILKPHIAAILNIAPVHTMQFEKLLKGQQISKEKQQEFLLTKIAEEKTKIITQSHCKIGIYNNDDTYIKQQIAINSAHTTLLAFGNDKTSTLWYGDYQVSLEGTTFTFHTKTGDLVKTITIVLQSFLLPHVYREVLCPAILIAKQCNLTDTQIIKALEKNFSLPKGRASMFSGIKQSIIIDSSYNASKSAVLALLDLAYLLKKQTKRPLVFVFGDMRELGTQTQTEHQQVAEKIIENVDYLYCVGPLTKEYVYPLVENKMKKAQFFHTSEQAGEYLKHNLPDNALVLVKGSQNEIFLEEAIKSLLENKDDEKNLCRQDNFWLNKKQAFFESISFT